MENYIKKYLINLNNVKIIERISSGAFGTVHLVQDKKTGQKYAAKIIHTEEEEQNKTMINREIGIMIRMQHPTIIKFYGYSLTDFEGKNHVALLLQFAKNGSLDIFLKNVRKGLADHRYDNTARQKLLVGIARGMMYLHLHNVIHRDLKPSNILLDDNLEPHITDFGSSKFYCAGQSNNQTQSVGTSIYMAPEVIEGGRYNGKADVYSFAILMFEVVTDSIPYEEFQKGKMSLFQFNMKVVTENYRPKFKEQVKEPIRLLIEQCWSKYPEKRPTFEEIFNRLAFNVEESVYDVFQNDEDTPKYYLDGVDQSNLLFYVDNINVEASSSNFQGDKLIQKVADLENENKKMASEQAKLVKLVNQQSDEIKHLNSIIKEMKERLDKQLSGKSETAVDEKKSKTGSDKRKSETAIDKRKSETVTDEKKSDKIIKIPLDPKSMFNGILAYLGSGSIKITASSVQTVQNEDRQPINVLNSTNDNLFFGSNNEPNSWLCIDFERCSVNVLSYSIKTHGIPGENSYHLQSWDIDGSNDMNKWDTLDSHRNENGLSGASKSKLFVVLSNDKYYRYIRIIQRGVNTNNSNYLFISTIEFFGNIKK